MVNQEINYVKGFNWRNFFKIVGSVFFIGLGVTLGINSNGKTSLLALSFLIVGIGIALIIMD